MKRLATAIIAALTLLPCTLKAQEAPEFSIIGTLDYTPQKKLTLWYDIPATSTSSSNKWMEYSLPIGNGQLGASLFGGVKRDEIQFNEKSLWSGGSEIGYNYGSYQNFGSLYADFLDGNGNVPDDNTRFSEYHRSLSLDSALCTVEFKNSASQTRYSRQYFASYPDKCVAVRYKASEKGGLNLRFSLCSGKPGVDAPTTYENGGGWFAGKLEVISYKAQFKVILPKGKGKGEISTAADGITVRNADEVTVILTGATDFDPYSESYVSNTASLAKNVQKTVAKAAAKGWDNLLAAHLADYMPIFSRMSFSLEGTVNTQPTNILIDTYDEGRGDNSLMLQQLYFAYGRYLEISSSRGIDLPSNLQGIWNNSSTPPWNSDIHSNINVQMNYWPAENTNLSEMHLPFLNHIVNMAVNHKEWQKVARDAGQSRGWTVYTENNNMGGMGAFMHNYVIANAWYASHLWTHYRYTLDKKFLKRAFPAMWSAAEFWLERLVKASDGTYECPNEFSPEQGPDENATAHSQQLVYELLSNTLASINVLGKSSGVSQDSISILKDRLAHLDKGIAVETYDGQWGQDRITAGTKILREWKYSPYSAGYHSHRHSSHLMCLYPFSQITPESPHFKAAVNSMKLRGDQSTGWSMGWKINLWARALDGNRALSVLSRALRHSTSYQTNWHAGGIYYNLYDSHSPFQIDGNFGACAGIAEMLMQSHTDTIKILPALPDAWPNGTVKGMKAVGDFTVGFEWKNGKLTQIDILSNQGSPLYVSAPEIGAAKITVNGKVRDRELVKLATVCIPAKKGEHVKIRMR